MSVPLDVPFVEVLCLANSQKHGGRCAAGLRTDGGGWVRPIGRNALRVLLPKHYTLNNGSEAMPLDLLRVPLGPPCPQPHHPEDCFLHPRAWQLVARPAPREIAVPLLKAHLARGPHLFGDCDRATLYARYQTRPAPASLAVISPRDLCWEIARGANDKKRTRAVFTLKGQEWNLPLTDLEWRHQLSHLPPGLHPLASTQGGIAGENDRVLLTVSLSEPMDKTGEPGAGHLNPDLSCALCYKLVASVMVIPQAWRG